MSEPQDPALKLAILKSTAVRQAMTEIVGEQRAEILRRARAKLTAMGVELSDEDLAQAGAGTQNPIAPAP